MYGNKRLKIELLQEVYSSTRLERDHKNMTTKHAHLYRHDEIILPRPYACDVDENDWLWQGTIGDRLLSHNLRTAELRVVQIPEMEGNVVFSAFAWQEKIFLIFGECDFYLVYNPANGETRRYDLPGEMPICWHGCKVANGKLLIFNRRANHVLVFDAPDAKPRIVACSWPGDLAAGTPHSDGLVYISLADPARLVRFDPDSERFLDERALPWPEAALTGRFEHEGVLYFADSAAGRLLPLHIETQEWGAPIEHPDFGTVFGFIGLGFGFEGKGYFCLSTMQARSRLDTKTGKIIIPESDDGQPSTVDGLAPRFMDRFLVYDPAQQTFDYLIAPEQTDGMPLLCYSYADEKRFVITGFVLPWARPGEPLMWDGSWLIFQSDEADEEPGFERYDFNWDRASHLANNRRSYSWHDSLFIPEPTHSPATTNLEGTAVFYPQGRMEELIRRAARTDRAAYWRRICDRILPSDADDATRFQLILEHVQRAIYYNPLYMPDMPGAPDALISHQAHDGRCGHGAAIVLALCEAAGIEARWVPLDGHVVAEAFYDNAWHYGDPLFFGGSQPAIEGRVLSVNELKKDPYFADALPQQAASFDIETLFHLPRHRWGLNAQPYLFEPELLRSEDDFQALGYIFGPWGSQPYYSFFLGAKKEMPATLPIFLPVRRLEENQVEIAWSPAIKWGGGRIEYELRIFEDRKCSREVLRRSLEETSFAWTVPQRNWMYFLEVRAMDDHRIRQPNTWYPAARSNFVLVPPEQYGWYGVL